MVLATCNLPQKGRATEHLVNHWAVLQTPSSSCRNSGTAFSQGSARGNPSQAQPPPVPFPECPHVAQEMERRTSYNSILLIPAVGLQCVGLTYSRPVKWSLGKPVSGGPDAQNPSEECGHASCRLKKTLALIKLLFLQVQGPALLAKTLPNPDRGTNHRGCTRFSQKSLLLCGHPQASFPPCYPPVSIPILKTALN